MSEGIKFQLVSRIDIELLDGRAFTLTVDDIIFLGTAQKPSHVSLTDHKGDFDLNIEPGDTVMIIKPKREDKR